MDIEMPVKDGRQASREIRALEAAGETRGPPSAIVALTANALGENEENGLDMDDCLVKPLRKEQLTRVVERFRAGRAAGAATAREP
eukprot:tig00000157_g9719.t1